MHHIICMGVSGPSLLIESTDSSLILRPSLPAFNVARKKVGGGPGM